MRYLILLTSLCLPTVCTYAYNPISAEPTEAYSVITIEGDPYVERSYLGDLEDAPDLYELKTDVAITLRIEVQQRAGKKAVPFGLMIVRQNDVDGGVEEIVRQNEPLESWVKKWRYTLGMNLLSAPVVETEILPGTYRIEVSTPDNKGAYSLTLGEEPVSSGYLKSLGQVFKTQHHFGFTPFRFLLSSYVYTIILVVGVGYGIYRYRSYKRESYGHTT